MSTLHRRDISGADFRCLAKFVAALLVLDGDNGKLPWVLGEVTMLLPVWYLAGSGWRLANYREFRQEALGLSVCDFRRVCRYIRVPEAQMIDILFRLSMICVVKGQRLSERPKYKMSFRGVPFSMGWHVEESVIFGFVIERRRLEGNFRSEVRHG